nr:MAG TPA: hypothetical protein [Caudoviricetes sp.]
MDLTKTVSPPLLNCFMVASYIFNYVSKDLTLSLYSSATLYKCIICYKEIFHV